MLVVDDPARALELVAGGRSVVLVVGPDAGPAGPAGPADPAGHAGRRPIGAGRLAVFVGEPSDPDVVRAAAAMDAELFGTVAAGLPRAARHVASAR